MVAKELHSLWLDARQNRRGIWLYNADIRQVSSDFFSLGMTTRSSLIETRSLRSWTSHRSGSRPLSARPTRHFSAARSAISSWSTDFLPLSGDSFLQEPSINELILRRCCKCRTAFVTRTGPATRKVFNLGWGALCDGKSAFGPWSKKEGYLHINCLEMLAVWLGLRTFLPDLRGHHVLICSDSMTVVSYINRQGGLSSRHLFTLAEHLLRWAQLNLRLLRAAHVPGKLNLGADILSRSNVPSDKLTLHPQMVQVIWGIFGRPEVNLFASEGLHSLPKLFLDRDVIIKDRDALAHDWPNLLL